MWGLVNDSNSCLVIRVDENDDTCYEITSTWMIKRYYGWVSGCTTWLVEIPSEINGVQVKSIWSSAFSNKWITWVIIPEWVTTINSSAFYGNKLKTLTLPSTITTIQSSAFYNNILNPVIWYVWSTWWITNDSSSYIKLVTPEMVEVLSGCFSFDSEKWEILDYYAWYKQECGENVEIPSEIDGIKVKSIWTWAFSSKWIKSVTIPEWVVEIKQNAFYSNQFTGVLVLDKWLESIWENAFCGQGRVFAIREWKDEWITMWNNTCLYFVKSEDSIITEWCYQFDKEKWEILDYNRWENCGTDVEIPVEINGVKVRSIWDNAFYSKWITSIIIPEWVKKIWYQAFAGGNNIKNVVLPSSIEEIWDQAFANGLPLEYVEVKSWKIGEYAFSYWNATIKKVVIWTWVTEIWTWAFQARWVREIEIKEWVKKIWYQAFANSNNIKNVVLPSTVKEIWYQAFANGLPLEYVEVKSWKIGEYAFSHWSYTIKKVIIWTWVTEIWTWAFYYRWVREVEIKEWVKKIWDYAFQCHMLQNLVIPWSVKEIWNSAFHNCGSYSLADVEIKEWVKKIWDYAFQCHVLQNLVIPWSVKEIWNSAFHNCGNYSLTDVEIKEWVEEIGQYAFNTNKLSRLILPGSVKVIWNSAFGGYHSLTSISIPDSLERLEDWAFTDFNNGSRKVLWITTKDPSDIEIVWDPRVNFIRRYSVTYDTQWGTEIEKQKYKAWDSIILPEDPVRVDYSFEWWDWEIPQKMPKENLVLMMRWMMRMMISIGQNERWK